MMQDWRGEHLIRMAPATDANRCRVCRREIDPRATHCHRHKPVHREAGRYATMPRKEP